MSQPWHISVLIPAKDEEQLMTRCLESVLTACDQLPVEVTTDVIVVNDDSSDETHAIALRILGRRGLVLQRSFNCVGRSRREAALEAIRRAPHPSERCWLANTDADCIVPPTWLEDHLRCAEQGYAGLAGIVDVDCFVEHEPHVAQRFRETYLLHRDGTHPHVHGANLGVRADAYLAVGGWGQLHTAEDHDLWKRLKQENFKLSSDASLKVITSGRRNGRAPLGFAAALAAHNEVRA